ncbi:MAG: hypothetical protein ACYDC3_03180 [Candidatus Binataceae bacterium]
MKQAIAIVAGVALTLAAAIPALAGVVITQEESRQGMPTGGGSQKHEQTITVQGKKERIEGADHVIIIDLEHGQMFFVEPAQKNYVQLAFPPTGPMAQMMARAAGAMNFKKEATTRKIAGYECRDYSATTTSMGGDVSMVDCYSTSAPGSKEYADFMKVYMDKFKSSGAQPTGDVPDGIPLASDATMKMNKINIPGLSADQQAKLQQMMKNRKPITTQTVVTKIVEKKVSADQFAVPAGYAKRELPKPGEQGGHGMMGAPQSGPAAAPSAH